MITDIHLQRFRSYLDASFDLSPGVNIIVGPNTSGKTNLLEAILVVAKGSSYRVSDSDLITFGEESTRLEAHTPKGERVVKISRSEPYIRKSYEINSKPYKIINIDKILPIVLFEPNYLIQLIGSPESRRNYVDDLLEQTNLGFAQLRRQYRRTLSQRNALLKKPSNTSSDLFAWNIRLSSLGGQIFSHRRALITAINEELPAIYRSISSVKPKIELSYATPQEIRQYESSLLSELEKNIAKDYMRGFTSNGPHRDDIVVMLNNRPAQATASRGEIRSVLLALKMIEANLLKEKFNTPPILLLDDVFSELDGARRQALTGFLQPYQTFITTTDADVVIHHFTENTNIIPLS